LYRKPQIEVEVTEVDVAAECRVEAEEVMR
jgi:hypothetical protein